MTYRGRFAPSATGPLHTGSIFAALISFCHARAHQGEWLIRIDDLDLLRCRPEYAENILHCLNAFGFLADEPAHYQSSRIATYQQAFDTLAAQGRLYSCSCSRKDLPRSGYPGFCRSRLGEPLDLNFATRIHTEGLQPNFTDLIRGETSSTLPGDFIVRRRDGLLAYQLACALDESIDGITHVIRGHDLIGSTPMQCFVAQCLDLQSPLYGHFPVLTDTSGHKLSKQTFAEPVDPAKPGITWHRIATLLLLKDTPSAHANSRDWIDYFVSLGDPVSWLPRDATVSIAESHNKD